jgi:hypothetical protein
MRLTAQSLQHQVLEEMKHIDPQHNKRTQLIQSLAKDRTTMITRPDHMDRDVVIMNGSDHVHVRSRAFYRISRHSPESAMVLELPMRID